MEVAIGQNGSTPFQREVREWQHIDPSTGALLSGRLEADRWTNGPLNKYGKVVDSQNFSQPNGTQHTQRKQLEVLQAKTSNGSMQVIRAQTIQTTSSRTSFTKNSAITNNSIENQNSKNNLSSITSNGLNNNVNLKNIFKTEPSLKLSNLMKSSGNNIGNVSDDNNSSNSGRISPHLNLTKSLRHNEKNNNHNNKKVLNFLNRYDHQQQKEKQQNNKPTTTIFDGNHVGRKINENYFKNNNGMNNYHNERETDLCFQRPRAASIDDLSSDWTETPNEGNEIPNDWQRVSKIRRSFQFPKLSPLKPSRPIDLPENSVSVSKIREELENGRRLSTAMRNNHIDLLALDTILNNSSDSEQSQSSKINSFLTAESLREIRQKLKKLSDENLYKDDFLTNKNETDLNSKQDLDLKQKNFKLFPQQQQEMKHTTNSLESRSRLKDNCSTEWHLRRKSYGFENMSPPNQNAMNRTETSTDSGIGRSGELENWSPTTESKRTVITFGDNKNSTTVVLRGASPNKISLQRRIQKRENISNEIEIKRHSIAVDESKYVRDNLNKVFDTKTSVHLNGFYPSTSQEDDTTRRLKRVEFCKTEVHFAAESGRVNIVETDGKPPPTNNFRRRRRSSGNTYIDSILSAMPIMHFGDNEKSIIFEQVSESGDDIQMKRNNVTISVANNEVGESKTISLAAMDDLNSADDQVLDDVTPKGILKNKPIKPKPYHLGENIEASDSLWGVKLKPVISIPTIEGDLKSTKMFDEKNNLTEKEKFAISKVDSLSVADHVKIVEERQDGGSGYSTKINLNLTDKSFVWNSENEPFNNNTDLIDASSNAILTKRILNSTSSTTSIQHLKSTSLIMQTINISPNLNRIPLLIQESGSSTTAAKLISNMHEITKSKSANSIFTAGTDLQQKTPKKYSSSLDGDYILNNNDTIRKSSSFSSNSSTASLNESTMTNVKRMETLEEETKNNNLIKRKPIAAPRVKALTSMYVNNDKCHIKQRFEKVMGNDFESDDSAMAADEEVKRYLGTESDDNIEKFDSKTNIDLNTEIFNSWSRIEANKNAINKLKFNVTDIPKSNIMSIEFKSPDSSLTKLHKLSHDKINENQSVEFINSIENKKTPTAIPRTTIVVKSPRIDLLESPKSIINSNSSKRSQITDKESVNNEPIKFSIPRGARQLREHELSFFGIKTATESNKNSSRKLTTSNDINTNFTKSNKLNGDPNLNEHQKWKNERPDLLSHSPVEKKSVTGKISPFYENVQKPSNYNRKKDLNRDEMILNEMTQTADQTLKTVAENHRIKNEKTKKRNIERSRTSKPLDTISEKRPIRSQRDDELEIKNYMKSTQEFERKCCSRRSSSASSVDSNISSNSSVLREKIRNSQLNNKTSNPKLMSTKLTSAAAVIVRRRTEQNSSSHDDTSANNSSTENLSKPPLKIERKFKRILSSNNEIRRNKLLRSNIGNSDKDSKSTSSRQSSSKRLTKKLNPTESSRKLYSDSGKKTIDDADAWKSLSRQSSERTRNLDRENRRSTRSIEHKTKDNATGYESECLKRHISPRDEKITDHHQRSKSSSRTDAVDRSRRSIRLIDDENFNSRESTRDHHNSRSHGTNRSSGVQSNCPIIVNNTTTKTIAPSAKHRNDKKHVSSQKRDKTKKKL